jgi:hypothetical protein
MSRGKRDEATEQEQTAGAGTYEATAKFQRIGCAPHRIVLCMIMART